MRARAIPIVAALVMAASLPLAAPIAAQDASPSPAVAPVTLTLLHNNDGESSLLPLTYRVGDSEQPLLVGGVAATPVCDELAWAQTARVACGELRPRGPTGPSAQRGAG